MMFGEMVAVEAGAVREFDQLEAILIDVAKWHRPSVDPIEDPELHVGSLNGGDPGDSSD
jgi:hypothetical protein